MIRAIHCKLSNEAGQTKEKSSNRVSSSPSSVLLLGGQFAPSVILEWSDLQTSWKFCFFTSGTTTAPNFYLAERGRDALLNMQIKEQCYIIQNTMQCWHRMERWQNHRQIKVLKKKGIHARKPERTFTHCKWAFLPHLPATISISIRPKVYISEVALNIHEISESLPT